MRDDTWTEVLTSRVGVLWAYDGATLGAFAFPIGEDTYLDEGTLDAIGRYKQDKETDLIVYDMYDESDFDGSVEEFMEQEVLA